MQNHLSRNLLKRILVSHNFLVAGRMFFEIFMSIFIWKQTQNLEAVVWFNLAYLIMHIITFISFSGLVKRGKIHLPRRMGLIGYALVYFVIYWLGVNSIDYIIPLGLAIGFVNGLYWVSYQVIRFDLTHLKNRGNYTGWESASKIGVEMVMPVLGGFIIFIGPSGYANLFLFGTILFLISFVIGNVKYEPKIKSRLHLRKTLREVVKNKEILKSMLSYSFSGLGRTGSLSRVLLPLFIFIILKNEFHLGGWLSFFSIIAIISSLTLGKYVDYKHYKFFIVFGGCLYSGLILSLIFFPSLTMYILFGILTKIVILFIKIPKRVISENLVNEVGAPQEHRIEYIAIREFFNISLGRILSFVVLLFVAGLAIKQLQFVLVILAVAVMIETWLLSGISLLTRS